MKSSLANGYTLTEYLVTLLILAILLMIGIPAYQYIIARNKATAYINGLVVAIHYAQSEALKRHVPVTLCKSADGQLCGGEWRDGWLVFLNPDHKEQPKTHEYILRVGQALPTGDQLHWRASLGKNDFLQFNALGNLQQDGRFIYCPHQHAQYATALVVSLTGRLRIDDRDVDKTLCKESTTRL